MRNIATAACMGVALLGLSTGAIAADNNANLSGIVAGTYQAGTGSNINDEGNGQVYLFGTMDMGPGTWNMEVRAGTTPAANGVSSVDGSNALVGETTDDNGSGRIAITQLFYELGVGPGQLRVGLLDPTAVMDGGEIANDEYTQFLADAFVNNPTIGFPSFVLGAAYQGQLNSNLNYKLFVGSDSGLEEADHTYNNVFEVDGDRGTHSKGAYTNAELDWHNEAGYAVKGGIWYDTGNVTKVGSGTGDTNPYGFYAILAAPVSNGRVQLRAGFANNDAQAQANFVSVAYQQPLALSQHDATIGVGVARTGASGNLPSGDAIYRAEAYWRVNIVDSFYVTPDIQYVINPGFDSRHDDGLVGGVRVGYLF